jgi:hypothetical protein
MRVTLLPFAGLLALSACVTTTPPQVRGAAIPLENRARLPILVQPNARIVGVACGKAADLPTDIPSGIAHELRVRGFPVQRTTQTGDALELTVEARISMGSSGMLISDAKQLTYHEATATLRYKDEIVDVVQINDEWSDGGGDKCGAVGPTWAARIATVVADDLMYSTRLSEIAETRRFQRDTELANNESPAASPEPPKPSEAAVVAVFDIEDSAAANPNTTQQLTEYLTARLMENGVFRVVPRDELRNRLFEAKAESTRPCFDTSCQIEIGKALAAQKTVSTKILRVADRCVITATVYDLRTEIAELGASAKTTCADDGLIAGVDQVVARLSTRK